MNNGKHTPLPLREILADVRALLNGAAHRRRGTLHVSPEVAALLENISATPPASTQTPMEPAAADAWEALEAEVRACTKCALCQSRTQTVFGDGSRTAEIVFVGEAPGKDEDEQGVPFVGRAGQLLTDIIEKGMKLPRSQVYICNVLKCRPPENRDPTPTEKSLCEEYLTRQLELLQPKIIVALGAHAAKTLLRTEDSTGKLRGKWHFYRGIPLRVTYHPAYLLRSPGEKRKTWDDIKHVIAAHQGKAEPRLEPGAHNAT